MGRAAARIKQATADIAEETEHFDCNFTLKDLFITQLSFNQFD